MFSETSVINISNILYSIFFTVLILGQKITIVFS